MRKRVMMRAFVALAALGAIFGFAASAQAFPELGSPCNSAGCHTGGGVSVATTQVSNNGSQAVFNVNVTGGTSWAVFQGSTKLAFGRGTTGQFTVNVGQTYTVFGVNGPTTSSGIGQTTVSPVGNGGGGGATDTVAPTTTWDLRPSYTGTATIRLTATDNTGGSGVANTFFILDRGAQTTGTVVTVSAVGTHTLQAWSVDASGNVETPRLNADFTVLPAGAVVDTTAPVTRADVRASYFGTATIRFTATDAGGSGGVRTFYVLDCGSQVESSGLVTTETGPHFVQYWSVDASGNMETPRNRAIFTVFPAPRFTMGRPVISPSTVRRRVRFTFSGTLSTGLPVSTTVTIRIFRRVNGTLRLFRTHTVSLAANERTWSIRPTQTLPTRGSYSAVASIRFNDQTTTAPARFFTVR